MNRQSPADTFSAKLRAILVLTGIFTINFLSRIILAPLLPALEADLNISHGQAGSLFFMISLGYFVTLAASGFVSARLNHRRTIMLSAATLGLAMIAVSLSSSLGATRIALIMVGLAAGLYLPSGMATLTAVVSQKNWGKAVAIHELAPNLGLVLAPVLTELVMSRLPWRALPAILGCLSLAGTVVFAVVARGADFPGQAPKPSVIRELAGLPSFWIMMVLFSLGIGASLGIYAMLPLFLLTQHGLERGWANALVALSRVTGLFMALLAGWAADRIGLERAMKYVLLTTGVATILLGMLPQPWLIPAVFLQPALAVCFFPAAFAALSRISRPETRNVAVSLAIPLAFLLGGGALPTAVGYMGEAGLFDLGIALSGGTLVLGAFLVRFIHFTRETEN
ncbi:MAG: MFS transporter [Proteobacteria bacterium]|nr:MFS transporter [Pseudomonadota bacterium]